MKKDHTNLPQRLALSRLAAAIVAASEALFDLRQCGPLSADATEAAEKMAQTLHDLCDDRRYGHSSGEMCALSESIANYGPLDRAEDEADAAEARAERAVGE